MEEKMWSIHISQYIKKNYLTNSWSIHEKCFLQTRNGRKLSQYDKNNLK